MNRAQRRAADRNKPGEPMAQNRDQKAEQFREQFQQEMLKKLSGGGDTCQGTDPDLLAVLREIRDNTGRIARALEGER